MQQIKTTMKYEKYKDSGIEWIGEIPQNWDVKRLKVLAKLQTGNTPPKENDVSAYYTDEGFLWVKPDNLSGFSPIKNTNEYLNEEGYKIARVVPKGTPLVCCIGSIGKYGVAEQDVAFNQQINAVIFNKMMDNKFGLYHISCQEEQHWYYANGNVVQILNTQNQGKLLFACPPINEQKQIAEYLDKKCGEIDRVVETEKAVIEKLKEYKQSIITEAVTKGLDKNVTFKDSGIEWIGKIPQNWKTLRIKNVAWLKGRIGWQGLKSDEYQETGAYLITGTDFDNGKINWDTCVHITKARFDEAPEIHIKENDLLITKDGTVGKVALALNCPKDVSLNSGVLLIRNIKDIKYNSKYLYYVLLSDVFWNWFTSNLNGNSTIIHLYQEQFYNFSFSYPTFEEQEQIVAYLDNKCSEIDKAIADKEQLIEKFTEYKKSLIYECVTGKRKVIA